MPNLNQTLLRGRSAVGANRVDAAKIIAIKIAQIRSGSPLRIGNAAIITKTVVKTKPKPRSEPILTSSSRSIFSCVLRRLRENKTGFFMSYLCSTQFQRNRGLLSLAINVFNTRKKKTDLPKRHQVQRYYRSLQASAIA